MLSLIKIFFSSELIALLQRWFSCGLYFLMMSLYTGQLEKD